MNCNINIKQLKIVDSYRNTGFVGLILSLETAINLFKYLHYNHSLEYLLGNLQNQPRSFGIILVLFN